MFSSLVKEIQSLSFFVLSQWPTTNRTWVHRNMAGGEVAIIIGYVSWPLETSLVLAPCSRPASCRQNFEMLRPTWRSVEQATAQSLFVGLVVVKRSLDQVERACCSLWLRWASGGPKCRGVSAMQRRPSSRSRASQSTSLISVCCWIVACTWRASRLCNNYDFNDVWYGVCVSQVLIVWRSA